MRLLSAASTMSGQPWIEAVALGWNDRNPAEIKRQLPGSIVLVGPVHDQMDRCRKPVNRTQQRPSEVWPEESPKLMAVRALRQPEGS
jgi:hypothetical protein